MLKKVEGHRSKIKVKRDDYIIVYEGKKLKRYLKTHRDVVRVLSGNEYKYYLRTDPTITKTYNGDYCMTFDAVYCECIHDWADPKRDLTVFIDKKYYLKHNTVTVNGKRQYYDKNKVCRDDLAVNTTFVYIKNCVCLHPEIYGDNKYTLSPDVNQLQVVKIESPYGSNTEYYARISDARILVDHKDGSSHYHSARYLDRNKSRAELNNCFASFENEDNPSMGSRDVILGYCSSIYCKNEKYFKYHSKTGRYVHISKWSKYEKVYNEWYESKVKKNVDKAIEKANKNFSDSGKDENKPSFMRFDRDLKPRWGGNIGHDGRKQFSVSNTSHLLGNINYTFGVEIETSDGFLSNDEIDVVGLCSMGDNSIRGNEYITQALHGDIGVETLKRQMNVVSDRCVVDDSCSIHVHVGGWNHEKVITPNFNINFAVNAIKLGCMIEKDLFMTQPRSRSPWKKHCHCITSDNGDYSGDFRDISMDNYRAKLGKYVFGRDIDREINSMSTPGRWSSMRYKWLNLRNAVSNTEISTIEFRIFAPTTSFLKALQAVRISLAFTWFVENRQKLIKKGNVTLVDVLNEAYCRYPTVLEEVLSYVYDRSKKFERIIY